MTTESAFDPSHPYFDEKSSRENPKWEVVHVEFRRKFDKTLTLETLKAHALPGLPLDGLQTIRQSRVSVSRVTPQEWEFIKKLIDDQVKADEKADIEMKDASEASNAEHNPESDSTAPGAESASSHAPAEPAAAASEEQPVEDVQESSAKGEETQVNGESTANGINGQTTTERLTSVITGAFLN
jgi:EVE domain